MGAHRPPVRSNPAPVAAVLRRNVRLVGTLNAVMAVALGFFAPGTSSSLAFIAVLAPLPVWAAGFAVAAAFQLAGRALIGYSVAAPLWALLAIGAVVGLLLGRSTAPAASVALAGLEVYAAAHHVNAMSFRRQEREAARSDR